MFAIQKAMSGLKPPGILSESGSLTMPRINWATDIVFVELPDVGESFEKGAEFGTVESVKAVSELYLPVSGEIVAINEALEDAPELINNTPFSDGWMIEVKLDDSSELDALMDKDAYLSTLKG
jgi:glycine cleavage system H protein